MFTDNSTVFAQQVLAAVAEGQQEVNVSVDMLIEQAKAEMNRGQLRRFERRSDIPGFYQTFVDEIRDKALQDHDDDGKEFKMSSGAYAALSDPSFKSSTLFAIDVNKIREFIDLILEYAPKLIDLVMLFLKLM